MKRLATLVLLVAGPSRSAAQTDTIPSARIAIAAFDGTTLGYITLGSSTPAEVGQTLVKVGGLGPARENKVTFRIGNVTMRPRVLYTPPQTMNQLYFQNDTLVLVVEGRPHGLPNTGAEFVARYPAARETHRESGWYELQTRLSGCIWLLTVFSVGSDRLESDGYAYVCPGS